MMNEFGSLFGKLVGVTVTDFESLGDINKAIEEKTHNTLHIECYRSSVVPNRGNIFRYSKTVEDLDQQIDAYLAR